MKSSISSFTYKGSIAEAILESKKQKKLFVVYISGENVASAELGKSTWTDSKVAESLSKYCILLHFSEGSTDALNFSAIYRQKSAPCITAIGNNGVQLWQSEGFVTAEVLASGLEKAWLTLHIQDPTLISDLCLFPFQIEISDDEVQETTASTVLTTALALKKAEPPSGSSDIGSSGQGSSSGTVIPVPLKDRHIQPSEVGTQAAASEVIEENKSHEPTAEKSQTVGDERSTCPTEEDKKSPSSLVTSTDNIIADHTSSAAEGGLLAQEKSVSNHTGVSTGGSKLSTTEIKEVGGDKKAESMDDMVPGTLNNNKKVNVSSDVHLNIRLPDGVSLQEKFSVTSTLRMVKDYVDRNQASGIGAYDLAIPYPRKTFSDQDLNKSLSELSLLNRQALIVVPHQRVTSYHQRGSLSDRATTTTSSGSVNANDWGYFACVKRLLSYVNPLSYFGGSANSSSSGQTQSAIGEYGPDSTSQNNTPRVDRPYSSYSPNQNSPSTGRNDSKGKQPATSRVGSNIHTLKHDEDDGRFSERNSFWNGNSTQYGGDNDAK
ncbi:hypothetical protein POTOM_028769 [Populus tomentosa]|uniref:UBX domain-containing protein n=1 Tax=Populus tomentosa TaxID=118781 RepID=A0A8X8CUY9_POPTO|nr:hypothetical protein POTOM_028769 [Populus tomentosa]